MTSSNRKKLIMLTQGTLATVFSEDDVTDVLAWDWWRASSANLRKNRRKASARVREGSARQGGKKEGGLGWQERKKGGVSGVGDDVIKKIKNIKI